MSPASNSPVNEESIAEEVDGSTSANELSEDASQLVTRSMAQVLGVKDEILQPFEHLLERVSDETGELDYDAFLDFVEEAAEELPELIDPKQASLLADELDQVLGTAVVLGARDFLRETN